MKKSKKIPYTPKYKFGGFEKTIFTPDADDKKKMKKVGKQAGTAAYGVGEGLLDTVTMGATDQLTDQGYYALQKAGNSTQDEMREQDSIRGFSNAAGAIGGAIINPGATGAAISQTGKGLGAGISKGNESKDWAQGAGMALNTAGQIGAMAYGQAGSPMTSGMQTQAGNFNASSFGQGLGKYNQYMNQGNMNGQMGGMLNSFMGGGSGGMGAGFMGNLPSGTPPLAMKYGGQMRFAMGGMNIQPNSEVEDNEMITSNTPPQVFANGGVELASNNPYGTPTYKTKGSTHDEVNPDGSTGIPIKMEQGSIVNGKTKVPSFMANKKGETFSEYMQKLTKDENSITKLKDNILKKAEKGDRYSKNSSDLLSLVFDKKLQGFAELKNKANDIQNAIIANKEQRKAINRGELPQPPMDNQQMQSQGMPEQLQGEMPMARYGGMMNYMAMGGVQLPFYNTDNAGNPMYAMGGGYPAMTNPYNNFKGSIPMYDDGGNMPEDPLTTASNGTTPVNGTLKVSDIPSYGKTGYDEASMKNKDTKFEVYNNPDYLIQNPNIDTGKWNDFQKFLSTYKLPTGENFVGNKAGNTKLANDYTNLAISDYNKGLSDKQRSVSLGDIEEVQKYYNQGDPNVPVDRILGSKTTQFRYPFFSSVSKTKAKENTFMPITYGGQQYVVDAKTYNEKILPVSEGTSNENVSKYFQKYDPKKHRNIDEKNVNLVNKVGGLEGGSGTFRIQKEAIPKFTYEVGKGTMKEQMDAYTKESGMSFKYGGQMPKYKLGDGNLPTNFNFERSRAFNQEQNQRNLAFNQMTGNKNPGYSNPNVSAMTDEGEGVVVPGVPVPKYETDYTNALGPDWYSKEESRKRENESMARIPDNSFTQMNPNSKNFDWGKLAMQGANFLGQNAGNIYDLTRKNEPLETYDLMTAKYLDPTQAIAGENYIGRQTRKAIPGLVGGNAGAAMNLLGANKAGTASRIGRLRETYDNANAQIANQTNQFNTGIKKDQAVARAANAAALENVRSQAIHKGGESFGKMTKSGRQDNMDQDTLKMFQWRYQNEPGFRKYIDNFSTQNNSGEAIV